MSKWPLSRATFNLGRISCSHSATRLATPASVSS
jgi:hypothetical protein